MKTQHQKIIDMCSDGQWHCGNEFRAMFIFSPHKRRSEISGKTEFYFKDRKCEHGHRGVKDYLMESGNSHQGKHVDIPDNFYRDLKDQVSLNL